MSDETTEPIDAPDAPAVPTTDEVLAALPVGSRAEWAQTATGPVWSIYRGDGLSQHGTGKSAARAVRVIGAQMAVIQGVSVLLDVAGDVIEPE